MPKAKKKAANPSELEVIKLEEKMIKAEKKSLERLYRWFYKRKNEVLKREGAIKERRDKLEGKESDVAPEKK